MDQCRLAGVERAYGTESQWKVEAEFPELKGSRVKWEGGRHKYNSTDPQSVLQRELHSRRPRGLNKYKIMGELSLHRSYYAHSRGKGVCLLNYVV